MYWHETKYYLKKKKLEMKLNVINSKLIYLNATKMHEFLKCIKWYFLYQFSNEELLLDKAANELSTWSKWKKKRPDLLCRDKLGGNFRDTWKCNWIWLKLLKKSSYAVTEVNSFSFFYAKGGWNLFNFAWYFRQQSFTMGIKEK